MNFPKIDSKLVAFSAMGLELGLSVIVGLVGGSWLDEYFQTEPWLLLMGAGFGIIAGYRSVYRLLKKVNQSDSQSDPEPDSEPES